LKNQNKIVKESANFENKLKRSYHDKMREKVVSSRKIDSKEKKHPSQGTTNYK
jgi:hypothetical protein